ncbi:long-chain-fatty-acid--CoA ligase [Eremomyces bilateralis CBS 781.70]|uniref:Long-chain-fatty-acid--CoA ligase n=1 Tax=Eremomyces bilateralis CBS 781.70 TaxID=1392243 RepID=A0A6G1G2M6_9PEZI|nr:long-chain-fatty-acid--CoA ligase [Eremomyces bilateralis CBS 781.70]KAF1812367.1 long-chain-fatty-acid--CoA ligase [Eremomyces bilateralis CBS 781.70]
MSAEQSLYAPGEQPANDLSILHGPSDPPLVSLTLSGLLDLQCFRYGERECLIVPWTGARWTYSQLRDESIKVAKLLLDVGIRKGDRVAIMAGNCEQYVAVVFAVARVGAVLVVLNNTYTANEALRAMRHTGCKLLFTTFMVGKLDNGPLIAKLCEEPHLAPSMEEIIILRGETHGFRAYDDALLSGEIFPESVLNGPGNRAFHHDVSTLLFTSGSTGNPKAAMLTHYGVVNNSRFIGDRMALTPDDVLCCAPPLFHCFGLVLGLLAVITHGSKIVLPAEMFDPLATLRSVFTEKCTALHGVPAMFDSIFTLPRGNLPKSRLRTGIIAGSPVPRHLMELMFRDFGMTEFTSSYGLTEASPTCFNAFTSDTIDRKLNTVGKLMPHAHAKIVDVNGKIVSIGTKGELCIAGYQLQAGYWKDVDKTAECMKIDENGVLWLHTGDEAVFDREGYCSITGRFKDLIIRGGENIYPLEIENRLVEHPSIERAIVVGVKHPRLGEVVGTFLQSSPRQKPISQREVREWTSATLGKHKAPAHVFWLGRDGIPNSVPLTGSGKIKKYELQALAEQMLHGAPRL